MDLNSVNRNKIQDFANKSGFEDFYDKHRSYYQADIEQAKFYLNVQHIKQWLEKEFPVRYNKYHIVISPLMNGFHFTKRLNFKGEKTSFMWVADADRYDTVKFTKELIAGIYTGVFFTEIDHNYVNPISDKFKRELDDIMGNEHRINWIKADGDGKFYSNGYSIFNEYMTHAVYLVYTNTFYEEKNQNIIEKSKIRGMAEWRKYYRFEGFYKQLKLLYLELNGAKRRTKKRECSTAGCLLQLLNKNTGKKIC